MVPHPKYGEIRIRGKRWRWYTVEHVRGTAPGARRPTASWSISFRDPEDPSRRFTCELPERSAETLSDRVLRELFEEARSPDGPT